MEFVSKGKEEIIFALDIGTRTVIGLLATVEENRLTVLAEEVREQPGRAMLDGQIHDIPRVAAVVNEIKNALEDKLSFSLTKVAVAAAGRALHTEKVVVEQEIDYDREIDNVVLRGLEMEALREAHRRLDEHQEMQGKYYCVGHSISGYSLDGYPLVNLVGHRGRVAGCEVIATFLPVSVVNGLYAVLERAGLEPLNLTLEPIAAIDVAIPENLRLLNLALVDMGAGTSDLAIAKDGTVVAYGMVPIAGDEITEALVEGCLVDFDTAEQIKRRLDAGEDIHYTDILGLEHKASYQEIMEIIDPVLEKTAGVVADNLLQLNGGRPPRSVFCVGGGCRVPTFTERLARRLELPPERVALRDRGNLRDVIFNQQNGAVCTGPEGVTVAGIALVAAKRMGFDFMAIMVNGKEYRLFNTRELNVSHALGLIQFNPRHLIAKNGKDLHFFLNGKQQVVFGELGKPAEIQLNGRPASLQSPVRDGDEIFVNKARNGRDARATVGDYLPRETLEISINGRVERLSPLCFVNGEIASAEREIKPGDKITVQTITTVYDLIKSRGLSPGEVEIQVNGVPVGTEYVFKNGDQLELLVKDNKGVDGRKEDSGAGTSVLVNGREVRLQKESPIFVDLFRYVDVERERVQGKLVLKLNGKRASYTDPLQEGDEVEIYWDAGDI